MKKTAGKAANGMRKETLKRRKRVTDAPTIGNHGSNKIKTNAVGSKVIKAKAKLSGKNPVHDSMARKSLPTSKGSKGNRSSSPSVIDTRQQISNEDDRSVFAGIGNNSEEEMASDEETRALVRAQNRKKKKSGGFQSMGLSHAVYKGVIFKGYKIPTPIQRKTIPIIMEGKDIVAMARTGSGKTAAFLIPMFERLKVRSGQMGARALIMSPTRELALQTLKFTKEIGKYTGVKAAVILGGDSMDDQFEALHANPDIIIATPGRFMHLAVEMELKLHSVEYVVFDEADRLFEMGFETQLREIFGRLSEKRQTLLFSATLPKSLVEFAKAGLNDPMLIRLDIDNKLSPNLETHFFQCRTVEKDAILLYLLLNIIRKEEMTVVFLATKHHVEYLHMLLQMAGISSCCVYSSLDQAARKINVAKFQHRKCSVMLVTDLAARGIDIPVLDNVINYHFPPKGKLFVHRVGRVARAGKSGTAYSLVAPDELPALVDLHLFLGKPLKFATSSSDKMSDGQIGTVPLNLINPVEADILAWKETSFDLRSMDKVVSNAFKLFVKSRPVASSESIKRVKELEAVTVAPHPLLAAQEDHSELKKVDFLNAMKNFRPKSTIFEIGNNSESTGFSVMQIKRRKHAGVIAVSAERKQDIVAKFHEHQKRADAESPSVGNESGLGLMTAESSPRNRPPRKKAHRAPIRDDENYISYRPSDYQSEKGLGLTTSFDQQASGAVLDFTGDEDVQIKRNEYQKKWDRKKKKFVGVKGNEKRIKTESGQWISASYKSDAYKRWLGKSKKGVSEDFPSDDESSKGGQRTGSNNKGVQILGHKQYRHHSDGKEKGGKRKFKRELHNKDEILKNRRVKEKQQSNMKRRELVHRRNKNRRKQ